MAFDPDAYLKTKSQPQAEGGGFDPDAYLKQKATGPNELESATRGIAQGATLNFADEISGGAEALWEKAKGNPTEFGKLYSQYRDESRKNFKAAEEANPSAYLAGEVGGGLLTAVVPMGATATVGRAATQAARLGAASSLGASEADNAKDLVHDVALGTGLAYAGGAAAKAIGNKFGSMTKKAADAQDAVKTGALADEAALLSKEAMPIENPNVVKEVAKSAGNRIKSYWNPDIDPSFEEFAEIARKNGINPDILPESVKFGPDSSVSRATRSIAEGRYGEETLKRFNGALDQVREAYDGKIANFSQGLPVDEVTAGKVLRDSYDEGVSKFFDQMDFTHNNIINQAPGLRLTDDALGKIETSLSGIEKFAKGRMVRGVTQTQRGQGQQLINAVEAIRAGNGSYKQTVEALRDIGEAAFQSKNSLADIPVDTQKMRKLYNDINESLLSTVRSQLGDDIANNLVQNNKAMSEFFGDQSLISRVMGDKSVAPERAFQSLILNGDTKKIEALRKIIPESQWNYLKGAVLENIVKRDPEGGFTFRQLYSNMRNKKSALSAIFTPEELAENAGLVRLGDRFGSPVLSSSGTGASLSFQDLTKSVGNITADAIAVSNANRAANRSVQKASQEIPEKAMRDVSPRLKELPSKAAGVLAGESYTGEPKKGPEKWVNDGAQKLEQVGIPKDQIQKLRGTKQGRNLLMEASDASPNSKRMESVLRQIRTATSQGGQ